MKMFSRLGVALITPTKLVINPRGDRHKPINWEALSRLVNFQIENKVNFLVPVGTTGESPTLSHLEHEEVVRFVVEKAVRKVKDDKGGGYKHVKVPVLAGTGSNNTAEAVSLTKAAKRDGADGVLSVSPYYNKPPRLGLLAHYREIADVGLPVILYNIEGRTAQNVPTEVVLQLAEEGSIVGVKEASGNLDQQIEIINEARKRGLDDFLVLSGDDNMTFDLMANGGHGVISVASNLIPDKMSSFMSYLQDEDSTQALKMHLHLLPLFKAMFFETNPIPVKTALSLVYPEHFGDTPHFRLPMCSMEHKNQERLESVLREYGLL